MSSPVDFLELVKRGIVCELHRLERVRRLPKARWTARPDFDGGWTLIGQLGAEYPGEAIRSALEKWAAVLREAQTPAPVGQRNLEVWIRDDPSLPGSLRCSAHLDGGIYVEVWGVEDYKAVEAHNRDADRRNKLERRERAKELSEDHRAQGRAVADRLGLDVSDDGQKIRCINELRIELGWGISAAWDLYEALRMEREEVPTS